MQFQTRYPGLTLPSLRDLMTVIAAAGLITLSAKVQIPFWPVPMTLHSLAVMVISAGLGPRLGFAAMATYLGAGLAGLPVFSGSPERGIGLAYALGPTGGYLLGYLLASWLTGRLAQGRGIIGTAVAMLSGMTLVYAGGLIWLATFVPASKVIAAGFTPFILGDLVKIALALMLIAGWRSLGKGAAQ